ncbi:MAG: hypothetical protein HYZ15_02600 [Sphingobacteriales bacterium]|nr:hypothetical protein [Sphingobacteriales bacterium]
MKRATLLPVIVVSAVVLLYCIFIFTDTAIPVAELIFVFFPLLLIWMVWQVIRDKGPAYPELREEQEFGYSDRED